MKPIAILYDACDAKLFLDTDPSVRGVIALTPLSYHIIEKALPGLVVKKPLGDFGWSRILLHNKRETHDLLNNLNKLNVPYAIEMLFSTAVTVLGNGNLRLWQCLGSKGPWLIAQGEGWLCTDDKLEAVNVASENILSKYPNFLGTYTSNPPPLPSLYRLIRKFYIYLIRLLRPQTFISTRLSHPFGLNETLCSQTDMTQCHIGLAERGSLEYLRIIREVFRLLKGEKKLQIKTVPMKNSISEASLTDVFGKVGNKSLGKIFLSCAPTIIEKANIISGAVQDSEEIVCDLKPKSFVSYEIADGISAAVAEAASRHEVDRIVANHNVFSMPNWLGPVARLAACKMILTQYYPPLSQFNFLWNPHALNAAQSYGLNENGKLALPLRRPGGDLLDEKTDVPAFQDRPASQDRIVLHAGNFLRWFSYPYWIYEDSDEYFDNIHAISRAINNISKLKLIIRTKVRHNELPPSLIEDFFGGNPKIVLKYRNSNPFIDDLAVADLLVANLSTTIMQALHARKPVLLWGGTQRFEYLPARRTLPTPEDRAAVYTVDRKEDLPVMIEAILDSHAGIPLTDAELEGLVWPESDDIPTVWELAQAIADDDILRPWSTRGMISSTSS